MVVGKLILVGKTSRLTEVSITEQISGSWTMVYNISWRHFVHVQTVDTGPLLLLPHM